MRVLNEKYGIEQHIWELAAGRSFTVQEFPQHQYIHGGRDGKGPIGLGHSLGMGTRWCGWEWEVVGWVVGGAWCVVRGGREEGG